MACAVAAAECVIGLLAMNRQQRRLTKKHAGSQLTGSTKINQLIALAQHHRAAGQFKQSEHALRMILPILPDSAEVHHNLGYVLEKQNKLDEAAACFKRALTLKPDFAEPHNSLGMILDREDKPDEAAAYYQRALAIKPRYANAHNNLGTLLRKQNKLDEAADCYERALAIKPDYVEALTNIGNVLLSQSKLDQAAAYCKRAISIKPDFVEPHDCLGNILLKQHKLDEAAACYERALTLKPDYADAYNNRGVILYKMKRYDDALASLEKAMALKPDVPLLLGSFLRAKLVLCNWQGIDTGFVELAKQIDAGKSASPPFIALATPLSMGQQKACAEMFITNNCPPKADPLWNGPRYSHERIRIGYFSSEFRIHPMARLLAEFFELHDRSKFEMTAFAFGPPTHDAMRKRLEIAFEHFIDVEAKTDPEIVALARSLEIDIAVDLDGFTGDARTGIFALRPAPVQVNYMGYPGTMGASYIDYLIADPIIIPEGHKPYYTEKIVHLPHTYWVTDSTRRISDKHFTRQEMGLPDDAFVFCCFNNNYKITPDVFDIWMRLLHKVEGSVLWLLVENPTAAINLRAEARSRGISDDRLVFAKRMEQDDHLVRQRLADLFLDTFYYNAHTTTSDALWEGLPVLTCLGETFAGRVAASLLNAVGVPELITHSHEEYEAFALELATHTQKLAALRQKLAENRAHCPLFNTVQFTRYFEDAYIKMWERSQAGQAPDHICVEQELLATWLPNHPPNPPAMQN